MASASAARLDAILQRCATLQQVRQLHAAVIVSSAAATAFLSSRLISSYSLLGLLRDSIFTFRSVANHLAAVAASSILWNSILRATLSHGRPNETISIFRQMRLLGVLPDSFTFPLAIRASFLSGGDNSLLSTSVHAQAVVLGYGFHLHVANELILVYSGMGRMDLARDLFDGMPLRNVLSWNSLISGFSSNFDCEGALCVFRRMEDAGPEPNPVTWTSLLSAHSRCRRHDEVISLFDEMRRHGAAAAAPEAVAVALSVCPYIHGHRLMKGKEIHCIASKSGFESRSFVRNSLVCMYGKLGSRDDAERLFSATTAAAKDVISWNALITSYAAVGLCGEAYEAFLMLESCGDNTPNLVSWSAVIAGFASAGLPEPSLELFRRMLVDGFVPNSVTVATVLSACAELSALRLGREVHGHTIRARMEVNLVVGNGLLHMYTRSGSLGTACLVFDGMPDKDLISWNTMIAGYGANGLCDKALEAFAGLVGASLEPDGVTFVAVLSACAHAGRVSEGRRMFHQMVHEHRLEPSMEHYACMVDLLGRAGQLGEAGELVRRMPMRPNACVMGALLNAFRMHGVTPAAEGGAAERALGNGADAIGNHMLLSNIYAAYGKWEESARVRVSTSRRGLKKSPGKSWIVLNQRVHAFYSGGSLPSEGAVEVCDAVAGLHVLMKDKHHQTAEFFVEAGLKQTEAGARTSSKKAIKIRK